MQKKDLTKLAIMGIASGCLIGQQLAHADEKESSPSEKQGCGGKGGCGGKSAEEHGNIGFRIMSEDELLLELNEKGAALYMNLNKEGKELARKVASQRCNGTNVCKGLNACQTENNSCAGQGACKGQGKCGFSDKNLAVKVVAKKMAEKRERASQ